MGLTPQRLHLRLLLLPVRPASALLGEPAVAPGALLGKPAVAPGLPGHFSSILTTCLDKARNDHFAAIGHCRRMCADAGGRPVGRRYGVDPGLSLLDDAADELVNQVRV